GASHDSFRVGTGLFGIWWFSHITLGMAEENPAQLLLEYRAPLLLQDRAPAPSEAPAPLPRNRAPRLLPLTLILGALLWLFTTTGGRHVFVNDMLSEAYDSQGENLLHGDATV